MLLVQYRQHELVLPRLQRWALPFKWQVSPWTVLLHLSNPFPVDTHLRPPRVIELRPQPANSHTLEFNSRRRARLSAKPKAAAVLPSALVMHVPIRDPP